MRILSNQDYAQITTRSLIADYDHETIVNLYQPIIGYVATMVYFTLLFEGKNQKIYSLSKHEEILSKMQLPAGDFDVARKKLEAVGLLKTYYRKENETVIYNYNLFAPRTPRDFFDNALLHGMLIKCVGEESAKKLLLVYPDVGNPDYGDDISCKFTDVFQPEYDDKAFALALNNNQETQGRNLGKIKGTFNYETFFKCLAEISQISSNAFIKKEMIEIERICTLYGIDEKTAANHVANLFDPSKPKGQHVDLVMLNKMFQREGDYLATTKKNPAKASLNSGTSDLAKKINYMESTSPKRYLSLLQNGSKPATADLKLIDDLSRNFGLTNGVINAVIDYVLSNCDNVLSRAYAEKISASLARENISTTIDAMNYLIKVSKSKKKTTYQTSKYSNKQSEDIRETKEVSTSKEEDINTNNNVDDVSWEELLDQIDEGGSDGKA